MPVQVLNPFWGGHVTSFCKRGRKGGEDDEILWVRSQLCFGMRAAVLRVAGCALGCWSRCPGRAAVLRVAGCALGCWSRCSGRNLVRIGFRAACSRGIPAAASGAPGATDSISIISTGSKRRPVCVWQEFVKLRRMDPNTLVSCKRRERCWWLRRTFPCPTVAAAQLPSRADHPRRC
jgi:hypothetical protein